MNPIVGTLMALALLSYTVGVWGERIAGQLRWWNFSFFVIGLSLDTIGTGMMFDYVGGFVFSLHSVAGLLAIVLMAVHAVWALVVLLRGNQDARRRFHRFSIFVWVIWLIPYFSPALIALLN